MSRQAVVVDSVVVVIVFKVHIDDPGGQVSAVLVLDAQRPSKPSVNKVGLQANYTNIVARLTVACWQYIGISYLLNKLGNIQPLLLPLPLLPGLTPLLAPTGVSGTPAFFRFSSVAKPCLPSCATPLIARFPLTSAPCPAVVALFQ